MSNTHFEEYEKKTRVIILVIGLIAYAFGAVDVKLLFVASLSAFLGSIFDSFLGSLFQVKYKCTECSKITEKEVHCGKPTVKYSGFSFFDNDVVNLLSGAFAAIVAIIVTVLIG